MFDDRMVIHFLDGRTQQVYGENFMPTDEEILVKNAAEKIEHIQLKDVKLICFVKQFGSDSKATHRPPASLLFQGVPGRKVKLVFKDSEKMEGVVSLHNKPLRGFFITPLNPNSNNLSIFVNPAALVKFEFLE